MSQSPWHMALITAAILLIPGLAFACVQEEWWFVEPLFGGTELRAPAEGPLLVRVGGGNSELEFDPEEVRFWVIDASENKLPGTLTVTGEGNARTLEWVPETPLTDETYRVELRHPAGGGTMLVTDLVVIEVPEVLDPPNIRSVRAWEIRQPLGAQECCEATQCRADDCGTTPETCSSCWYEDYEYPISMLLQFDVPPTFPSHWLDVRYFQVDASGEEIPIDYPGQARFPEGAQGPYCLVVELHDVVGGRTSRETACTDELDEATRAVDNSEAKAACAQPPDQGCSTTSATPGALLLGLPLFGVFRRRRRRRQAR